MTNGGENFPDPDGHLPGGNNNDSFFVEIERYMADQSPSDQPEESNYVPIEQEQSWARFLTRQTQVSQQLTEAGVNLGLSPGQTLEDKLGELTAQSYAEVKSINELLLQDSLGLATDMDQLNDSLDSHYESQRKIHAETELLASAVAIAAYEPSSSAEDDIAATAETIVMLATNLIGEDDREACLELLQTVVGKETFESAMAKVVAENMIRQRTREIEFIEDSAGIIEDERIVLYGALAELGANPNHEEFIPFVDQLQRVKKAQDLQESLTFMKISSNVASLYQMADRLGLSRDDLAIIFLEIGILPDED